MLMIKLILFILTICLSFTLINSSVLALPSQQTNFQGSPDILVTPIQGPSVKQLLIKRTQTSWPWYLTRASGLIAGFSLFILILSGIGLVSGYTFKFLEPLTSWATHRALGIVFGVSVLVHGGALLFDKYVPFNITQILFPFVSNYKDQKFFGIMINSPFVALGIIAMYLFLAMLLTTFLWIDKKPKKWKMFHFLSYLIVIFVFFHALYIGTDLIHGFIRTLWIIVGIVILATMSYRFLKIRNI